MKLLLTAAATAALLSLSSAASARIVCNEDGDCWHARDGFEILPGLNLTVHPDDWRWKDDDRHHRWREHEGRGYWRGGEWHEM